jgi:hypothetical protein
MRHVITTGNNYWEWNGSIDKPTLRPSILVSTVAYHDAHFSIPKKVCHSFVTDGCIEFLSDCTHELKSRTVEMEEFP